MLISEKRPFWIGNDEDKPTGRYLIDEWVNENMYNDINTKVHAPTSIEFPTLATKNINIKYAKINDIYYYTTKMRILANGVYLFDLEIDKWASYFHTTFSKFLDQENNVYAYVKRSYEIDDIESQLQYEDPLMENIIPDYYNAFVDVIKEVPYTQNTTGGKTKITINKWSIWNFPQSITINVTASSSVVLNYQLKPSGTGNNYYVKLLQGNQYCVFFDNKRSEFFALPYLIDIDYSSSLTSYKETMLKKIRDELIINNNVGIIQSNVSPVPPETSQLFMLCDKYSLDQYTKSIDLPDNVSFYGIFLGPNFYTTQWETTYFDIDNKKTHQLILKININEFIKFNDINFYLKGLKTQQDFKLNQSNYLYSPAIMKYAKIWYYENELSPRDLVVKDNKIYYDLAKNKISFNGHFVLYIDTPYNMVKESIKTYGTELPNTSSQYRDYIRANLNSINTGLSIANQQAGLGIIGGVGAMGYGALTGNPLSFFGGALATGGSIFNNINKKRVQEAKLQDIKNSSKPNITNTATLTGYFIDYGGSVWKDDRYQIGNKIKLLQLKNISLYNNVVVKYGYIINQYDKIINHIKNVNGVSYLQVDGEDLYNRYSKLFSNIPNAYLSEFIDILSVGIRLWDKEVEWRYE